MTNGHLVKWDATALKFVDAGKSVDNFVQKTSAKGLYGTDVGPDGVAVEVKPEYTATPGAWKIPQWDASGKLRTNDPKDPLDAVNKQYFEAHTAVFIDNSLLGG